MAIEYLYRLPAYQCNESSKHAATQGVPPATRASHGSAEAEYACALGTAAAAAAAAVVTASRRGKGARIANIGRGKGVGMVSAEVREWCGVK